MKLKTFFVKHFVLFSFFLILMLALGSVLIFQWGFKYYIDKNHETLRTSYVSLIKENLADGVLTNGEEVEIRRYGNQNKIFLTIFKDGERLFQNMKMQGKNHFYAKKHQKSISYEVGHQKFDIVTTFPENLYRENENGLFFYRFVKMMVVYGAAALILAILVGINLSGKIAVPIFKIKENALKIKEEQYHGLVAVKAPAEEIRILSEAILDLGRRLSAQEALRKQVLQDISHELKNPLAIMQGRTEALMDEMMVLNIEEISILHEEVLRMKRVIDELNYVNDKEGKILKLNFQKENISNLILGRIALQKEKFRLKEISLCENIPQNIDGVVDEALFIQIVDNLLSNAYKYTEDGGQVQISLQEKKGQLYFCVSDTGIGILEEDLPFLFERFFRGQNAMRDETEGLGLGLSLVKKYVDFHEGEVNVYRNEPKGTTFEIKIPKK